ncbi:MAG: hypothetical protein JO113_09670 [Candidatus Eremiobacteraeota bacterium]|nr:hypothetical protein [Candidatus Eremiobacteraeota bacterium]
MGSTPWETRGNAGTNPPTDYLGTPAEAVNKSLVLKTAGAERVRIDPVGNVGIGTNDPAYALDVNGHARVAESLDLNALGGMIGFNRNVLTGAIYDDTSQAYQLGQNSQDGQFELQHYDTDGSYIGKPITVDSSGNVGFCIDQGANVAIGTDPTDSKLQVNAETTAMGPIQFDPTTMIGFNRRVYTGEIFSATIHAYQLGHNVAENDEFQLQQYAPDGTRMGTPIRVLPTGDTVLEGDGDHNVGIGTPNPAASARLTVSFPNADTVAINASGINSQLSNDSASNSTAVGILGQVTNFLQTGANFQTAGVLGINDEGHGVQGRSNTHVGVEGDSNGSTGVFAYSNSGVALWAQTSSGPLAGFFQGAVQVTGPLTKSGGGFRIDHPLDPANQYLNHSFVESSEMKNVYDGMAVLDANGEATVKLPVWFNALNERFRYQLTPVGAAAPQLHIADEVAESQFRIAGGAPNQRVCWQVTGVRKDLWAETHPLAVEEQKTGADRNHYLNPELFGRPEDQSVMAARYPKIRPRSRDPVGSC